MKAYLFDVENGLYQGETFVEPFEVQPANGITTLPAPEYRHGEIPVFDSQSNMWVVLPANVVRQQFNTGSDKFKENEV
jgi:hypothetical protein